MSILVYIQVKGQERLSIHPMCKQDSDVRNPPLVVNSNVEDPILYLHGQINNSVQFLIAIPDNDYIHLSFDSFNFSISISDALISLCMFSDILCSMTYSTYVLLSHCMPVAHIAFVIMKWFVQ